MQKFIRLTPAILTCSRFVFGPLLYLLAVEDRSPWLIALVLLEAMLSDIYDGVIARRLKIATAPLRVLDSRADAWFFIWVGIAMLRVDWEILKSVWYLVVIELILQIGSYIFDLIKYKRIASLHAYSAKVWGFSLYLAVTGVLVWHTSALIWLAFCLGLVSAADALAIKLMLPTWQHDVLSSFHARKLRIQTLSNQVVPP